MEAWFLSVDQVESLHADLIEQDGGSRGIRERGLLESAVAQPMAAFEGEYLHADLFEMAAAYLFHLTMNHPFIDGNKRIGLAAALTFLDMNGLPIETEHEELYEITIGVA
ncbi:MAG: type II toxin-antitoxin system death-on-curing family toxin [Isosphaeraceae bacterium]